jgi:hypothetical protein
VLAERGGDMLVERAAVSLRRGHAGEDARLRGMTAAHARMVEAGDDGEVLAQILERREILGQLIAGPGLFGNESIAEDPQRQTDEQKPTRLFPGLRGVSDATERFEPRQGQSDASATEEAAAGEEGWLGVHGGRAGYGFANMGLEMRSSATVFMPEPCARAFVAMALSGSRSANPGARPRAKVAS